MVAYQGYYQANAELEVEQTFQKMVGSLISEICEEALNPCT